MPWSSPFEDRIRNSVKGLATEPINRSRVLNPRWGYGVFLVSWERNAS